MREDSELKVYYEDLINELLKEARHDFLNELQLIYGYIRLNKPEKAIDTINRISESSRIFSKLSKLNCLELYILLTKKYNDAKILGLNINYEVDIYSERRNIVDVSTINALKFIKEFMEFILQFLHRNADFQEHIFYIEEYDELIVFKIDLEYIKNVNIFLSEINSKFMNNVIDENYLIYKLELIKG